MLVFMICWKLAWTPRDPLIYATSLDTRVCVTELIRRRKFALDGDSAGFWPESPPTHPIGTPASMYLRWWRTWWVLAWISTHSSNRDTCFYVPTLMENLMGFGLNLHPLIQSGHLLLCTYADGEPDGFWPESPPTHPVGTPASMYLRWWRTWWVLAWISTHSSNRDTCFCVPTLMENLMGFGLNLHPLIQSGHLLLCTYADGEPDGFWPESPPTHPIGTPASMYLRWWRTWWVLAWISTHSSNRDTCFYVPTLTSRRKLVLDGVPAECSWPEPQPTQWGRSLLCTCADETSEARPRRRSAECWPELPEAVPGRLSVEAGSGASIGGVSRNRIAVDAVWAWGRLNVTIGAWRRSVCHFEFERGRKLSKNEQNQRGLFTRYQKGHPCTEARLSFFPSQFGKNKILSICWTNSVRIWSTVPRNDWLYRITDTDTCTRLQGRMSYPVESCNVGT